MKAFIESQFGYCSLVQLFHNRNLNNKVNRIHEKALRITYIDKSSSSQDLLGKDNSVIIHDTKIRILQTETRNKVQQGLSLPLLNDVFLERDYNYNLRRNSFLNRRRVNSVRCGTKSVSYLAPKIWGTLPKEIRDSQTLNRFKAKIKKLVPGECPCRLCKTYIPQEGFM